MQYDTNQMRQQYVNSRMDELEWIQRQRKIVRRDMLKSRKRMKQMYNNLTHVNTPQDTWGKMSLWMNRGANIAQGLRIGYKIGDSLRTILRLKRMFSKR